PAVELQRGRVLISGLRPAGEPGAEADAVADLDRAAREAGAALDVAGSPGGGRAWRGGVAGGGGGGRAACGAGAPACHPAGSGGRAVPRHGVGAAEGLEPCADPDDSGAVRWATIGHGLRRCTLLAEHGAAALPPGLGPVGANASAVDVVDDAATAGWPVSWP